MFYDFLGNPLEKAYDFYGNVIPIGDYSEYADEYQHTILNARNEWLTEQRSGDDVISQVIHADQHDRFLTGQKGHVTFPYLAKAVDWSKASCIGLGDVDMDVSKYGQMSQALSGIPKSRQINIIGNHDLWRIKTLVDNQYQIDWDTLYPYFNNDSYGDESHAYNHKGIEYHIDRANNVKYVCIAGWEIDYSVGGYSYYIIGSESMDGIIDALSKDDGCDIVILSHIQPFNRDISNDTWTIPYQDALGGGGLDGVNGGVSSVVNRLKTTIDQMLIDRQNHASGLVKDSYGNDHPYDFTGTTGQILACYAGHEHCDWYKVHNGNIPILIYDAFAYDTHPFYFVNINRTKEHISVWRVDDTPQIVRWTVPFAI